MRNTPSASAHVLPGLSKRAATAFATFVLLSGCSDSSADGEAGFGGDAPYTTGNGSNLPSGESACYDAVLAKRSQDCTAGTSDCSPLECEINYDGYADRCSTIACVTDSDCDAKYGGLCSDVQWVCEAYITSDNRRCSVRDASSAGTGIALCDAIQATEGCGSEHVDRCVQGWPAQEAAHPECDVQIGAVMECFADQTITCRRDADVSVGFGTDPDSPDYYAPGLYAINEFGVSWYPGEYCGVIATAWVDCIYPQ